MNKWFYLERNRLFAVVANYQVRTLIALGPLLIATEAGLIVVSLLQGWASQKLRPTSLLALRWRLMAQRRLVGTFRRRSDAELVWLFDPRIDSALISPGRREAGQRSLRAVSAAGRPLRRGGQPAGLVAVAVAVGEGHGHAAEADGGDHRDEQNPERPGADPGGAKQGCAGEDGRYLREERARARSHHHHREAARIRLPIDRQAHVRLRLAGAEQDHPRRAEVHPADAGLGGGPESWRSSSR